MAIMVEENGENMQTKLKATMDQMRSAQQKVPRWLTEPPIVRTVP